MIKELLNKVPEKIRLLLFWPAFGIVFYYMELVGVKEYHTVHCFLDDLIPFCEYFIVPYYFWFVFLIGMVVYGFFWDLPALKNYMKFTAITYTVTLFIYAVYPTAQDLRPQIFAHSNFFINIVKFAYSVDTSTNVCPSIHVLGSMAVYFAAAKSRAFGTRVWKMVFLIITILISLSTLFVKQHSAVDIILALILGVIAYPFVYPKGKKDEMNEDKTKITVGIN